MLQPLGVTELAESAYRALLAAPGVTVPELAGRLGRSPGATRRVLGELEELGLVNRLPGRPVRLLATHPESAIDLLVARRREELEKSRVMARALAAEVHVERQPSELLEIVVGQPAIAARFTQFTRNCRDELLVFDRPPYANPADEGEGAVNGLLGDGVRVRGIYAPESLSQPGGLDAAVRAAERGELSRVHPRVPMKLAIADRQVALLPLVLDDMVTSAVIVRPSALLDALIALFELLWEQAAPLLPAEEDSIPAKGLLTLLVAGLKDETIARQLGVSSRTVSRHVADLMDRLGARTRFQAGVLAERQGLLAEDD
ncbi:helix-turn-helix transcriptional regulator [Streptomyces hainanensis]|uniref:Helix-turn-helix transcriptional regulator n=1 Tax=Streptomyces hainanensis TaxID=402648 RepID=A0A4R4T7B1_9ACTN|nr:helix-turn-helix transcriptional regulator [Streptomyces hainanensis]TDC73048.1 helix-turn-helix transcriptional regulator [Streptomyces hainanensis]